MDLDEVRPVSNARAGNQLTKKQWVTVTAVATAATAAGPIAAAGAAIGVFGGCYVSNKMGWSDS